VGCSSLPGTTPGDPDPAERLGVCRDAGRARRARRVALTDFGQLTRLEFDGSVALKKARRRLACPFPQQIGPIVGVSNIDPAGRRELPQQ